MAEYKTEILSEPEIIISNPESKHNYFAWPSVAKLQNGKIAVACSGFRLEHICPFGKACIALSEDNSNTYSAPYPVIDTVLDDRDAGVVPFGENGVIVTSFNNTTDFQRSCSPDNKYITSYLDTVTDEEQEKVLGSEFRISLDGGVTYGKIYKSPVTSPHGPAVLSDGTILWTGRIFNEKDSFKNGEQGIRCYTINTDGEMQYRGQIPDIENLYSCEPHVAECEDGTLICHIRIEHSFTIYQSESYDKGCTWSTPHRILPDKGGSPAHLLKLKNGLLISVYGYREFPYGIKAMISDDNGKNWKTGFTLYENKITDDLGYPATVELDDGTLLTVFYAHPSDDAPAVIMQIKWKITNGD